MAKIIGIDLGTTFSAVAVVEAGEPRILENAEGARTTPSIVTLSKTGERLAGVLAKRQAVTNPQNTIFGIKRFIGHRFDEDEVQKDKGVVPYAVEKGSDGGVLVKMGDKNYRPEEISAMILQKLKRDAEAKLGGEITEAVITVPAYFNDAQRKATQDAGKIAGLDVKRIINEPTAAALAYGFNKRKNEKIVVFDFGGGTFDVSVLEVGDDVIEVKSTDGDAHMGGKDIDQKMIHWIANEFLKESGIDLRKDPLALQRLDEAAEKAKHELSVALETEINIPFITSDASGPRHLLLKMTRATLEELAREFVDKSITIARRALEASPFKMGEIDEVILVGGQTRMPAIEKAVKELFGREPNKTINPDEVVALGAAIQGAILRGEVKDVLLLDVIPLSLGIETLGGVATKLIERNTTIPTSKSQVFSTAADNQTSVEIHIVQGERAMAVDNKSLGRFILDGVAPAPRGMPQIEVDFDVDANGVLNVTAKDKATGKVQSIRIEARSGLSDLDIARMQKDAEAHQTEDREKREKVDLRNVADQLVYMAEKSLKDAGDKIPDDIKKSIEAKIADLKKAKDEGNSPEMKSASEALSTELQKIGEHLYKSAPGDKEGKDTKSGEQSEPTGDTGTSGEKGDRSDGDSKTRDADFEEKS